MLRQDRLESEQYLVFHEMAHAIQRLAFTQSIEAAPIRSSTSACGSA
ncbi:hypothetical protein [Corallococcus llansteffanensis]|nr:hypothetical protein [Corallococcus llansteffanensis]